MIADSAHGWEFPEEHSFDGRWNYGTYDELSDANDFMAFSRSSSYLFDFIGGDQTICVPEHGGYPRIGQFAMAPSDEAPAVKRWVSQYSGEVTLLLDCQLIQDSVDGVVVGVVHNGESLLEKELGADFAEKCGMWPLKFTVSKGDSVDLVVWSRGHQNADWVAVRGQIFKGDPSIKGAVSHFAFDECYGFPTAGVLRHTSEPLEDYEKRRAELIASGVYLDFIEPNCGAAPLDAGGAGKCSAIHKGPFL